MRRTIRFTAAAATIAAACATITTNADALSLGPAGAKISTPPRYSGTVYQGPSGYAYQWGGFRFFDNYVPQANFECRSRTSVQQPPAGIDVSGTLNGSASATLTAKFVNCVATRLDGQTLTSPVPVTIQAPGGVTLTATRATGSNNAILAVGKGGLSFTTPTKTGTCTLTVPAGTRLGNNSESNSPATVSLSQNGWGQSGGPGIFGAYTGSAGCSPNVRGTHSTGFGSNDWVQQLTGLQITP